MGFGAAPVCSETFTMAEDPKASAVGEKKQKTTAKFSMEPKWVPKVDFLVGYGHKYVCH
jgi:hypothetical protein